MKKRFLIVGIVCILTGLLLGTCTIGCQSTETLSGLETLGDGNELQITTEQTSNNPWPFVVLGLGFPLLIFIWMYLDKAFPWFGRRDS